MHSNWWLSSLSFIEIAGLAGVIAAMVWRRQVGKWRFLFASILIELSTNLVLMCMLHSSRSHEGSYKAYFFTYWGSLGIQALLRMGIIADILRSFEGIDFLPQKLYTFVGMAGFTMACASAYSCFHDSAELVQGVRDTAIMLDRCVNIAWGTFTVAVLGAIKLFNLGWSRNGARIGSGVFVRICVSIFVGEMLAVKSLRLAANGLDSLCSIAVFFFWIFFITKYAHLPEGIPDGDTTHTNSALHNPSQRKIEAIELIYSCRCYYGICSSCALENKGFSN